MSLKTFSKKYFENSNGVHLYVLKINKKYFQNANGYHHYLKKNSIKKFPKTPWGDYY